MDYPILFLVSLNLLIFALSLRFNERKQKKTKENKIKGDNHEL